MFLRFCNAKGWIASFFMIPASHLNVTHHVPQYSMPLFKLHDSFAPMRTSRVRNSPHLDAIFAKSALAFPTLHGLIQNKHADSTVQMPANNFAFFKNDQIWVYS